MTWIPLRLPLLFSPLLVAIFLSSRLTPQSGLRKNRLTVAISVVMGNSFSNIIEKINRYRGGENGEEGRVVMCGMDGAGKTTLMHMLNPDVKYSIPTIGMKEFISELLNINILSNNYSSMTTSGFNMEESSFSGITAISWDVGGRCNMRALYRHFYESVKGIVFIIDGNDRNSWYSNYQKEELHRMLTEDSLAGLPLLVLSNKADLPSSRSIHEVVELLELKKIEGTRPYEVRAVSATSFKKDPKPIKDAFNWLKHEMSHVE